MLRKPSYAGSFYDSSAEVLFRQFEHWFSHAAVPGITGTVRGIICPHAGYMYSGFCAAVAYQQIRNKGFKTAVILHPSHRSNHFGYSISPFADYQTPLGNLQLRQDWAEKLKESGAEVIDASYHQSEHSMEVQLPFLTYIEPSIRVLPVMIGHQTDTVSRKLAAQLYELIQTEPEETIVIVSTDLSHYYSGKVAEQKDGSLVKLLLSGDAAAFYQNIRNGSIEACGFGGILTLMYLAGMLGGCSFSELLYTNSGHKTGDFEQVVGYLSAALLQRGGDNV